MAFDDFMSKVRQLDYMAARWLLRHFYFLFFQVVLILIFFIYLYETFRTMDQISTSPATRLESLVGQQNLNNLILTALAILNSFWMLYMFNTLERLRTILKDISFQLMRRKS